MQAVMTVFGVAASAASYTIEMGATAEKVQSVPITC